MSTLTTHFLPATHMDNESGQKALPVREFFMEKQITVLEHLLYLSDLV